MEEYQKLAQSGFNYLKCHNAAGAPVYACNLFE